MSYRVPMTLREAAYEGAMTAARWISPLLASGSSKVARGIRGRRGAVERLVSWGDGERDPERPLVWFHAPSVGEGLQARAVIRALAGRSPDAQVVFTHFSPSAEGLASHMEVDVSAYLPWDVSGAVVPVLASLSPDLLAFTKTEVWPVLGRESARRGIPTVLVGATLPPGSSRLRPWSRFLLAPAYRRLERVAAISPEDVRQLPRLGVPEDRIAVTGDPGIDSAWSRVQDVDDRAPHLLPFRADSRPTVVAGSTWPADEAVLVPALTEVRRTHPDLRLVIAPHEPTDDHVEPLVAALRDGGWAVELLGAVEAAGATGADAVVVDRVGVLAHLYAIGTIAYVGGGFHDEGLHSVLEPAASGLPVLFGPRHRNARAAGDLLDMGGARTVQGRGELAEVVGEWLTDGDGRDRAGERAGSYVESHRGAADRTAALLMSVLDGTA